MSLWDWDSLTYWLPLVLGVLMLLTSGIFRHHGSAKAHTGGRVGHSHAHGGARAHAGKIPVLVNAHAGAKHQVAAKAAPKGAPAAGARHGGPVTLVVALHAIASFLGFEQVPAPLVVSCIMTGWGLAGLLGIEVLPEHRTLVPWLAAASSVVLCRSVVSLLMRIMPQDESYAARPDDFVGLVGRVVYAVTENGGRVHVYDRVNTLHVRFARTRLGFPPIPANAEICVIDVDPQTGDLIVQSEI